MTYLKICLWSVSYTPVMLHSHGIIDCRYCTKDIPGKSFHLIPFLEAEMLVEEGVYPTIPYFPYPMYAHYSIKKVYVQIK